MKLAGRRSMTAGWEAATGIMKLRILTEVCGRRSTNGIQREMAVDGRGLMLLLCLFTVPFRVDAAGEEYMGDKKQYRYYYDENGKLVRSGIKRNRRPASIVLTAKAVC